MVIERVDALLDFGKVSKPSAGTVAFENSIDVGAGKADRLEVVFTVGKAGTGGTSIVPLLQASADGSTWTTIKTGETILTADLVTGKNYSLSIPDGTEYTMFRPALTVAGTFTALEVSAVLDTYR